MVLETRPKTLLLVILVIVLVAGQTIAANTLNLSIRLHNEEIYFPDSQIELFITLRNDTAQPQTFRLADDRSFNLNFEMRRDNGSVVTAVPQFTTQARGNQVFYRSVTLEPGEHFSFVEPVTRYVAPGEPGLYTLTVQFFPHLLSFDEEATIFSNPVSISIRPGETAERRSAVRFEAIAEDHLRRLRLPPDETVQYMLEARRESNWERFFLYLNLERLYRQSPSRDRQFRNEASEETQRAMLDEYREELIRESSIPDSSLTVIPDSYEILETAYTPTEGTVVAQLNFDYSSYRERKRYTYRLDRRNGFWEIIGYEVSNLPNEVLRR